MCGSQLGGRQKGHRMLRFWTVNGSCALALLGLLACSSSKIDDSSSSNSANPNSSLASNAGWQHTVDSNSNSIANANTLVDPNSLPSSPGLGSACTPLTQEVATPTPCTSKGAQGAFGCVAQVLVCQICTAGQTRDVPCPACNEVRHDVCSVDGTTWQQGVCGVCPAPVNHCEQQDACAPGAIEYRVCDTCTGGSCQNSRCNGAQWQCGNDCQWHQQTACAAQQAECSRDAAPAPQSCGLCGTLTPVCDGCFLHVSDVPCLKQGVCQAGTQQTVPCADNSCQAGYTATANCNAQCQWDGASACTGCMEGATQTVQVDCAGVQTGTCGQASAMQRCVSQPKSICDGSAELQQNVWQTVSTDTGTCSTTCGGGATAPGGCTQICTPGETKNQSCAAACGLGGAQTITCQSSGCGWSSPTVCQPVAPNACIPGTVQNMQKCAMCPGTFNPPYAQETCQADCKTWNITAQCTPCN